MRGWTGGVALGLWLLVPGGAVAQGASLTASAERYEFDEPGHAGLARSELFFTGATLSIPVAEDLLLEGAGGWGRGRLVAPGGGSLELSGPMDTWIGFRLALAGGRLLVRGDTRLPGTAASRTVGEARVAGLIGSSLLAFPASGWNAGGSAGASLEVAGAVGTLDVRVGAGFRLHREHELLTGSEMAYARGSEVGGRLVVDGRVGRAGTLSVSVGGGYAAADRADGEELFQAGPRLEGLVTYAAPMGLRGSGLVFGGVLHRAEGDGLVSDPAFPGLGAAPSRTTLLAGGEARLQVAGLTVAPQGGLRIFRSDAAGCLVSLEPAARTRVRCPGGRGWMLSAGAAVEVHLGGTSARPAAVLAPRIGVRLGAVGDWVGRREVPSGGSILVDGRSSGVRGFEIGASLRLGRGR